MSTALDESVRGLDDCGCCTGTDAATPVPVSNRPGLPAVAWRVGTHATFLESMRAGLSALPALRGLGVRSGDFTLALLDAWATVGDVLTFYQERIANESWLRTATERRSVLELARQLGYELRPGVAAATHLAFSLEEAPGAPAQVTITAGTRVQSLPGPKEVPQTFETGAAVVARPGWNAMTPRQTRPQTIDADTVALWVQGAPAAVQPGDAVLLVGAARETDAASTAWSLRFVRAVWPDAAAGRTRVELDEKLGTATPTAAGSGQPKLYALRQRAAFFGHNAPDFRLLPLDTRKIFDPNDPNRADWPGYGDAITSTEIDLDGVYPRIVPLSWLVLARGTTRKLFQVKSVLERTRSGFALSMKVTSATLDVAPDATDAFKRADTTVLAQSEALERAEEPVSGAVLGRELELAARVDALEPGRTVIVRGPRARIAVKDAHALLDAEDHPVLDDEGTAVQVAAGSVLVLLAAPADLTGTGTSLLLKVRDAWGREGRFTTAPGTFTYVPAQEDDPPAAELAVIKEVDAADPEHPVLVLDDNLTGAYDRAATRVLGNVAPANHGETTTEPLGSGDASIPFQRFTLRQKPLTYTPGTGPSGGDSTLEVQVGELRWNEVPTLYARGPRERVYTVRRQDDGTSVVQFGDGKEGARLPTGAENVRAVYRKGIGRAGNVRAGQLSLLMTRELGVKTVDNPLAASGGMDPEEREAARAAAPVTVLTLDRVVSLRDYQDFARAFAGVAKAQAVWSWEQGGRGVLLTVAGPDGDDVPEGGPVQFKLLGALAEAGDPRVTVRVKPYRKAPFRVAAEVRAQPGRVLEPLKAAVDAALRERFAFAARRFGQAVRLSEVMAAIQSVPGVLAVDVNALHRLDAGATLNEHLDAAAPAPGDPGKTALGAELLVIQLGPDDIVVKT